MSSADADSGDNDGIDDDGDNIGVDDDPNPHLSHYTTTITIHGGGIHTTKEKMS